MASWLVSVGPGVSVLGALGPTAGGLPGDGPARSTATRLALAPRREKRGPWPAEALEVDHVCTPKQI